MPVRSRLAFLALFSSLFACGRGSPGNGRVEDSSAGTVSLGLGTREPYHVEDVANAGTLSGTIRLQAPRRDSLVLATRDAPVCGDTAVAMQLVAQDSALGGALVWVDGITGGKPLPALRRTQVTLEKCHIDPRVLAVTVGTTVNVFTLDPLVHEVSFYRESRGEPVASVTTVDDGQIVPTEKIASEAGIVEARCVRHPWLRAYIAVFDHPYFAVTDSSGAFTIADLPPGTWTVKVWHEGMTEPASRQVTVSAGDSGKLDLALALDSYPRSAASTTIAANSSAR